MATNRMRAIHPGEIIREEYLVPMNMSAHALAIELRVPATRMNDIVRERRAITPDTALRLARCFGTTAQFWLNLQSSFDLKQAESETGKRIEQEVRPLEKLAAVPHADHGESGGKDGEASEPWWLHRAEFST